MLVTQCNIFSYLVVKKNGTMFGSTGIVAQKRELGENSGKQKKESNFPFRVSISRTILAQSAVAVFGLGFIDAGYIIDLNFLPLVYFRNFPKLCLDQVYISAGFTKEK